MGFGSSGLEWGVSPGMEGRVCTKLVDSKDLATVPGQSPHSGCENITLHRTAWIQARFVGYWISIQSRDFVLFFALSVSSRG